MNIQGDLHRFQDAPKADAGWLFTGKAKRHRSAGLDVVLCLVALCVFLSGCGSCPDDGEITPIAISPDQMEIQYKGASFSLLRDRGIETSSAEVAIGFAPKGDPHTNLLPHFSANGLLVRVNGKALGYTPTPPLNAGGHHVGECDQWSYSPYVFYEGAISSDSLEITIEKSGEAVRGWKIKSPVDTSVFSDLTDSVASDSILTISVRSEDPEELVQCTLQDRKGNVQSLFGPVKVARDTTWNFPVSGIDLLRYHYAKRNAMELDLHLLTVVKFPSRSNQDSDSVRVLSYRTLRPIHDSSLARIRSMLR